MRPTWAETWMEFAHSISKRSYDNRRKVGSVIINGDNTSVLACGYNGNYAGGPNIPESEEPGQSGFLHSEINCLLKCDYHNPSRKTMYVTTFPCRHCAKAIVNSGIKRVVYDDVYRDMSSKEIFDNAGVEVLQIKEAITEEKKLNNHNT